MCFYLIILILGSGHFFLGTGLSGSPWWPRIWFSHQPFCAFKPCPPLGVGGGAVLWLVWKSCFPSSRRGDETRLGSQALFNWKNIMQKRVFGDISTFALRWFSQEHLMKPRSSAPPPVKWVSCPAGWKRDLPSRCWLHPLKVPCFCLLPDLFLWKVESSRVH